MDRQNYELDVIKGAALEDVPFNYTEELNKLLAANGLDDKQISIAECVLLTR